MKLSTGYANIEKMNHDELILQEQNNDQKKAKNIVEKQFFGITLTTNSGLICVAIEKYYHITERLIVLLFMWK